MPSVDVRMVECIHQEVQIRCQRLLHSHLGLVCPYQGSHQLGGPGIGIEPCGQGGVVQRLEVALHPLRTPRFEILLDTGRCPLWLQP